MSFSLILIQKHFAFCRKSRSGAIYGASGRTAQAREILQRLKTENASPYNPAVLYAALGEKDAAFELLEKQAALNYQ